jgi:hypothetical protein
VATCFVIQPFDSGPFDKRYEDTIEPAVSAAGLEPYRVDRDPRVVIPIEQIEEQIKIAHACVADISSDNPNVWFELGYAIAANKPVVLIAQDDPKRRFPFDVQHRHITRYRTDSARDFEKLRLEITARLIALLQKEEHMERVAQPSSVADVQGLSQYELVALVSIAENIESPTSSVAMYNIRNDMERAKFTRVAVMLALGQLARKGLINFQEESDYNNGSYAAYVLTEEGMNWLYQHQDLLVLNRKELAVSESARPDSDDDDDVPF